MRDPHPAFLRMRLPQSPPRILANAATPVDKSSFCPTPDLLCTPIRGHNKALARCRFPPDTRCRALCTLQGGQPMAGMLLRRSLLLWIAALAWLCLPATGTACPFCSGAGQTLTGEVNLASMVLYGTLANAKLGNDTSDGTTDLVIDTVIKKHDILGDKKTVTLSRYVPTDGDKKFKFLVFCDIFKGRIDPYRGIPVKADSDMAKYLAGALAIKDKDTSARLRFFFDYLDNGEVEISNDAYGEFAKADYKDRSEE